MGPRKTKSKSVLFEGKKNVSMNNHRHGQIQAHPSAVHDVLPRAKYIWFAPFVVGTVQQHSCRRPRRPAVYPPHSKFLAPWWEGGGVRAIMLLTCIIIVVG